MTRRHRRAQLADGNTGQAPRDRLAPLLLERGWSFAGSGGVGELPHSAVCQERDLFGDVDGVVADPLQAAGDGQAMAQGGEAPPLALPVLWDTPTKLPPSSDLKQWIGADRMAFRLCDMTAGCDQVSCGMKCADKRSE